MKRTISFILIILTALAAFMLVPASADDYAGTIELSPVVFSAPDVHTDQTTAEVAINVENLNGLPLISATITVRIPGCTITAMDESLAGKYVASDFGTDTLIIMWAHLYEGFPGSGEFAKLTVSLPEDAEAGSSFDVEITVREKGTDPWDDPGDFILADGTGGDVYVDATAQNGSIVFAADKSPETTHYDAVTSGDWTFVPNSDGSTVTIVRYNGMKTDVAIPGEVDGHTVTRIAWADDGDLCGVFGKEVEKVTIPDTVTTVGVGAFAFCTGLKEITIPSSVTKLEEYAFSGCKSLKSIVIPDSVTDLGYQTFEGCTSLESVVIGDGVTGFGAYVFYGCTSLTSVTLGKNVKWIGLTSFQNCTALKHIEFPDGMEEIGDEVFVGCTSLESVTIPVSVTKICELAFAGCTALSKVYYAGSKEDWDKIETEDYNDELLSAEIIFAVPAADDYAATSDVESTSANGVKTAPQTGDGAIIIVAAVIAIMCVLTLIILKRKKEQ